MASISETKNMITLRTGDGKLVDVEKQVAMEFDIVKSFFDENPDASSTENFLVPIPNVSADSLGRIVSYFNGFLPLLSKIDGKNEIDSYNRGFAEQQSLETLRGMVLAANYLDIKDLLEMLCQSVADRIKNKSVEFARKFFGIENDYTREEEAELRRECPWAFENVDPDS